MGVASFAVIGEGRSDDAAFLAARLSEAGKVKMAGRIIYQILDPSTIYPTDAIASRRVTDMFGVCPQIGVVSPAGVGTNTVYAVRVLTDPGLKRLLFFGLMPT